MQGCICLPVTDLKCKALIWRFLHEGYASTRWFKYDRDKLWLVYTQIIPVIFEPPCKLSPLGMANIFSEIECHKYICVGGAVGGGGDWFVVCFVVHVFPATLAEDGAAPTTTVPPASWALSSLQWLVVHVFPAWRRSMFPWCTMCVCYNLCWIKWLCKGKEGIYSQNTRNSPWFIISDGCRMHLASYLPPPSTMQTFHVFDSGLTVFLTDSYMWRVPRVVWSCLQTSLYDNITT
jgi:hypothetical protein